MQPGKPKRRERTLRQRLFLPMAFIAATAVAPAKPILLEGVTERAPSPYSPSATHLLRDGPQGPIIAAVKDARGLLGNRPLHRIRVVGHALPDRIEDDLLLIVLTDVLPASWSAPDTRTCPPVPGAWAGCGTSLYPGLRDEPFPRCQTFTLTLSPPPPPRDTDHDGVPDSRDAFPTDPTETTDTDHDGVGNNADPDDDNDQMPDSYEISNGLNRLVPDGHLDRDGDGMTNLEEYLAGTLAIDPGSVLKIISIELDQLQVQLSFLTVTGRSYSILGASEPDVPFIRITDPFVAVDSLTTLSVPVVAEHAAHFYLIQVSTP